MFDVECLLFSAYFYDLNGTNVLASEANTIEEAEEWISQKAVTTNHYSVRITKKYKDFRVWTVKDGQVIFEQNF